MLAAALLFSPGPAGSPATARGKLSAGRFKSDEIHQLLRDGNPDQQRQRILYNTSSLSAITGVTPPPVPSVPLLDTILESVRADLALPLPPHKRIRLFWAGVMAARDLAATDIITHEFTAIATASGLQTAIGRHGDDDLDHVLRWALRGLDPLGTD
jgi:hypothetical protein